MTMTNTDLAQMPVVRAEKLIPSDYLRAVIWPTLGLGFAVLCTIAWCTFLVWLLINLFA